MNYGFIRVAAASPEVAVADCAANADSIISAVKAAHENGACVVAFPELCVTGYTCGDLFLQRTLQKSAVQETLRIVRETKTLPVLFAVGLPIAHRDALYNCAAVIFKGTILAVVPKTYIPNYSEFYERRYFVSALKINNSEANASTANLLINNCESVYLSPDFPAVPFSPRVLIFDNGNPDFALSVEICEDMWAPLPASTHATLSGASLVLNLSASNEIIGKAEYRRLLVKSHSARNLCAYVYADAGAGESTQDLIFAGHNIIAENGAILAESKLFSGDMIYADVDLERVVQERRKTTTFSECAENEAERSRQNFYECAVDFSAAWNGEMRGAERAGNANGANTSGASRANAKINKKLLRHIPALPFVPSDERERAERSREVIAMQAHGLAKRLRHIKAKKAVLGLSGGLDSTLALLVTCRAFDLCGISREGIRAITMPCFGTTDRTHNNALALARELGASMQEINIADSVRLHFRDIGQNENTRDTTYENAQARERTQVLMDIANKDGGIVIGTGDLSELALGWCTYNGDHMSMYGVNASIPKTLVRHLVKWCADDTENKKLAAVLNDILATPVSPELLPPEKGAISQKTEDIVGPYELHDFFLYYMMRFGFSPAKILFLADNSDLPYAHEEKLKWLRVFYRRFFSQQFKRSCMPDGVKVGTVSLSPRGDWRMPSDASAAAWLSEIDSLR